MRLIVHSEEIHRQLVRKHKTMRAIHYHTRPGKLNHDEYVQIKEINCKYLNSIVFVHSDMSYYFLPWENLAILDDRTRFQ